MKHSDGAVKTGIAAFALCLVIALAAWAVFMPADAVDIPAEPEYVPAEIVYITVSGRKYHREDCQTIANSKSVECVSPEKARENGYEACMICVP